MLNAVGTTALTLARCFKSASGVIVNEHVLDRQQTRRHVDLFGRWFEFIHLKDLPERLRRRGKRPFCLLTFDDGKRSNATVVAPELQRLGVPAAFYVVTSAIESQAPLWFDRYRALRRKLGRAPNGWTLKILKELPYTQLTEQIERACARYGVDADVRDDNVGLMTWDQVREMHRSGFSVGAHGHTHAILTREPKAAALSSIEQSLGRITQEIGEPCASFAFPNGNYTAELAQHAVRCGAQTVMTTEPLWADQNCELWRLPRLQFFGEDSPGKIELKAAIAATGRFLKNPDGTGHTYRTVRRVAPRRAYGSFISTKMGRDVTESHTRPGVEVNAGIR
jgi:peptidoglycan/xylan/chitin deacetylase (PgdA/CDA1 family)